MSARTLRAVVVVIGLLQSTGMASPEVQRASTAKNLHLLLNAADGVLMSGKTDRGTVVMIGPRALGLPAALRLVLIDPTGVKKELKAPANVGTRAAAAGGRWIFLPGANGVPRGQLISVDDNSSRE